MQVALLQGEGGMTETERDDFALLLAGQAEAAMPNVTEAAAVLIQAAGAILATNFPPTMSLRHARNMSAWLIESMADAAAEVSSGLH